MSIGTEVHTTTISSACKSLGPIMLIIYRTLASRDFSMVYDGVTRTKVMGTKEKSLRSQFFTLYMVGDRDGSGAGNSGGGGVIFAS